MSNLIRCFFNKYLKGRPFFVFIISFLAFIVIWYGFIFISNVKNVIPYPHVVLNKMSIILTKDFFYDFLTTICRTFLGFTIGCILAIVVGYYIYRSNFLRLFLHLPIDFLRSLPSIALLPLILMLVRPNGPIHIVMIILSVFLL